MLYGFVYCVFISCKLLVGLMNNNDDFCKLKRVVLIKNKTNNLPNYVFLKNIFND